jgi:hypothetical protein
MVAAGLKASYPEYRPLDYSADFKPVKSLNDVTDYSVVMLTNGLHIQMIDTVNERGHDYIRVDLCQSTKGGPQRNRGVTIRSGPSGGDYLPVQEFRNALNDKAKLDALNAERAQRGENPLNKAGYEGYLRSKLTIPNTRFGYCGGAIFTITATGDPQNIISGSVYIGTAGITVKVPGSGGDDGD